jgi:SAM-dependent methyltransferase
VSFSAEWLALREPADLAARNDALLVRAAAQVATGGTVLDLGSGTGSTARAFAAHGFTDLRWRFFDNDPALLDIAAQQTRHAECTVGNLADIDALPLEDVALVTASALLDLMPQHWVDALAQRLSQAGIPFYAALSYDGVMRWTPQLEEDDAITAHFNRHQSTDKGIGPALGATSGAQSATALGGCGFDVHLADSPWIIDPDQAALHAELVSGIGAAAAEAGMERTDDWTQARREIVETSQAVIGHTDLLALPS